MEKIIKINNKNDYIKFLNKIWFYKSVLYKNVKFRVEGKNYEYLDIIVNALNIKKRKKRIEYIYDQACELMDKKMDLNICAFKNDQCLIQRRNKNNHYNGCCLSCKHQNKGTCDTKNLACKLFYCPTIKKKYNVLKMKEIDFLRLFSLRQRLILKLDFCSSREEVLKDLYSYSFILSFIAITFRNNKLKFEWEDK